MDTMSANCAGHPSLARGQTARPSDPADGVPDDPQGALQALAWGRPASKGLGQHAGVDLCVGPQVVFLCLLWTPLRSVSMGCDLDGCLWFAHRKNDDLSHYGLDRKCPLKIPVLKTWSPNLWCCGK